MEKYSEKQVNQHTQTVITWLQSPIGQEALADIKSRFPNLASNPLVYIGTTLGKHAQSLSDATINNVNVLEVAKKILGYKHNPASQLGSIKSEKKAKSSAENGKKGGRPKKQA